MIIDYNKGVDVAPEEQIRSLCENVQLAFDEQQIRFKESTVKFLESLGINASDLEALISNLSDSTDEVTDDLSDAINASQDAIIDLMIAILTEFEIDVTSLDLDSLDFKDKVKAIKTAFIPELKAVLKDVKDLKENYTALEARVSALEE